MTMIKKGNNYPLILHKKRNNETDMKLSLPTAQRLASSVREFTLTLQSQQI